MLLRQHFKAALPRGGAEGFCAVPKERAPELAPERPDT